MASAAATLAVAGAALRLANPCGISGVAKPVAQQDRRSAPQTGVIGFKSTGSATRHTSTLVLDGGVWHGRQIVSAGWIKQMIAPQSPRGWWFSFARSYGYLWWQGQSEVIIYASKRPNEPVSDAVFWLLTPADIEAEIIAHRRKQDPVTPGGVK
jgi:CubicO group peptidase (beta-lactamase class C family)